MQMECPEVFYAYEWALAAHRAYSGSMNTVLVLGYEGDRLTGVVALALHERQKTATFLAGSTADYCDFICAPQSTSEFVDLVISELKKLATTLVLANVPVSSATGQSLMFSSRRSGPKVFTRPAFACAQIELASIQQRDQVRRSMQSKKLNRWFRLLTEQGRAAQVLHLTGWQEISVLLPKFRAAHIQRFQEQGRSSNLVDAQRWEFVQELARLLSQQGWMKLSCLLLDDQVIAWNYGFQFSGSWFWYQPTFDSQFHLYSPGLCLLAKVVEQACDDNTIRRVDLGLGDEGYKRRFATGVRNTTDITVSASRLRYACEKVRYRTVTNLKAYPQLDQCVRWFFGKATTDGARA